MADLTSVLKEQIPANISTIIGKEIEIKHICQTKKEKLQSKYIKVESVFESPKITYQLNYFIPANLSSYILNVMMMDEDAQISEEVDDDKADAVKEIVSTINGSSATAINAQNFDEIGEIKVAGNEVKLVENIQDIDLYNNFIKFELKVENRVFDFIIDFSNEAKPFYEELFSSQECVEYDEADNNEKNEEVQEDEQTSEKNDDNKEESKTNNIQNEEETNQNQIEENDNKSQQNTEKDDNNSDNENESEEKLEQEPQSEITNEDEKQNEQDLKKEKKLKLLIIIIASLLFLVIGGFAIAYFMGVFEPPPPPPKKIHKNPRKNKLLKVELKDKKIDFKLNMINVHRLNKRLSLLTKYEILDNDILEKFKQEERTRLQKLKIKQLEAFAKANKEESLKNLKKENFSIENRFIYIQIEPLKYKKYKKIINSKLPPNSNISICLDKNKKAQIYVGPLVDKEKANILVKDIKEIDHKKDTKLISLTKDEFNKLCDF